jgi:uncharacterized iron-regulated membrane protein
MIGLGFGDIVIGLLILVLGSGICVWFRRRRRKKTLTTGLEDTPSIRDVLD